MHSQQLLKLTTTFVGNPEINQNKTHPFFKTLYHYNPQRWKKAVAELWKLVSIHMD